MPGKSIKIRIERLHVDRLMGNRLRAVYKDRYPVLMGYPHNLLHWVDHPEYVRHLGDSYELRPVGKQPGKCFQIEFTALIKRYHFYFQSV